MWMKLGHSTCCLIFYFVLFQTFSITAFSFVPPSIITSFHTSFRSPTDNIFLHALLPSSCSLTLSAYLLTFLTQSVLSLSFPHVKHLALIMKMTGNRTLCTPFYTLFFPPFRQQMKSHPNICMQAETLKACQ